MALLNHVTREITAKVVYYGPGLCGKTSNLKYIYDNLEEEGRGNMLSLATEADRTLFFDFLPMELGTMRGFKVRLQLYTVPGQVFYEETRKRVLKGCDGVVLVADSQRSMQEANRESLAQLSQHLSENGLVFAEVPLVLQYNKRDLPDLLSIEEMDADLNPANMPFFEAVASEGIGVEDTLKAVIRLVLKKLVDKGVVRQEGDLEVSQARGAVQMISQDTSPGFTTPLGPQDGEEAVSALFGDDSSELAVGLEADLFAEPQVPETESGANSSVPAPEGPLQTTAPEWLFSEAGEDTASLLAVATPIEDAVVHGTGPPEELFYEPDRKSEPDSLQEVPAFEGDEVIATLAQEGADSSDVVSGDIPKFLMASGQIQQMDLVIAGRTYRLKIQLEEID